MIPSPDTLVGKVSIVIPCYNRGSQLREALDSVDKLSHPNLAEVIIVDDGSTEAEACRVLLELENSGRLVLRQSNRGPAAARNAGISRASGEFILPLDSDNLLRAPYLDQGVQLLRDNPDIHVVYADHAFFGLETGRRHVPDFDLSELVRANFIDTCALYRKRLWEELKGYDEMMPTIGLEDWDFWLRAAVREKKFVHLDEVAFDYRRQEDCVSSIANRHADELADYIFAKKELWWAKAFRQTSIELESFRWRFENSPPRYSRLISFFKTLAPKKHQP